MQPNTRSPSVIKSVLLLLLMAFACIATLLFTADRVCNADIELWIPFYPQATVVSSEHDFIRARAMGTTTIILATSDDEETVRQFYRDTTLALLDAEETRGLTSTSWDVQPNPDGTGSLITLYSECGR